MRAHDRSLVSFSECYAVRRLDLDLITSRSARFTELAVGNSAATSGASKTKLVPSAKLFAYFPRTAFVKSYSVRIAGSGDRGVAFLVGFFIENPFPTASGSSADDSNGVAALDMDDNH
jgi:hypothetical protein